MIELLEVVPYVGGIVLPVLFGALLDQMQGTRGGK